mmetsp:Transcript_25803/g.65030  ORF Transcript_25803/g.65030 Transcript_25803/m.65030 type:complete len:260 (-) Transcript_25803:579-1358(-)
MLLRPKLKQPPIARLDEVPNKRKFLRFQLHTTHLDILVVDSEQDVRGKEHLVLDPESREMLDSGGHVVSPEPPLPNRDLQHFVARDLKQHVALQRLAHRGRRERGPAHVAVPFDLGPHVPLSRIIAGKGDPPLHLAVEGLKPLDQTIRAEAVAERGDVRGKRLDQRPAVLAQALVHLQVQLRIHGVQADQGLGPRHLPGRQDLLPQGLRDRIIGPVLFGVVLLSDLPKDLRDCILNAPIPLWVVLLDEAHKPFGAMLRS